MLAQYPLPTNTVDLDAEADVEWIKGVIIAIRNIRGEMDISPAKNISVFLSSTNPKDSNRLDSYRRFLEKLAKLSTIEWLEPGQDAPPAATGIHGDMEILVPLAGLIDVDAERNRLSKEIAKLEAGLKAVSGKLGNAKFVSNAPDAVVAKEKEKQEQLSSTLNALQDKLKELDSL
jgi:valyl-tRNA synthetase